jgi:hypothetical protein
MASYRLYCLDGAGKIMTAEWLEADSDEAALEQVRERQHPLACEVWDPQRLVGRVEPHRG